MGGAVPLVVAAVAATAGVGVGRPEGMGILMPAQRWRGLGACQPVEAVGSWVATGGWGVAGD